MSSFSFQSSDQNLVSVSHFSCLWVVGGGGGIVYSFLTLGVDGGGQHHELVVLYTQGERILTTHSMGGQEGPRVSLDAQARRKILALPGIEPQLSSA
jgi:hypothetical protein